MAHINQALELLNAETDCKIMDSSFLYETRPMYVENQPLFLNGVIKIHTKLDPKSLLWCLKRIEAKVGRVERERNGPREVDLDILLYDHLEIQEQDLIVPHPLMKERLFVLKPLCDVGADFEHPSFHRPCSHLLKMRFESLKDDSEIEQIYKVLAIKGGKMFNLSKKTLVMGILNVTPDSFSGDGSYYIPEEEQALLFSMSQFNPSMPPSHNNIPPLPDKVRKLLIKHVAELKEQGCDILDIGGYSTRPNASEVPLHEELRRILPVIKALVSAGIDIPISVDTFRAKVAEEALKCGATIVNDVSGGSLDPQMISTVAKLNVPICLMHIRGNPKTMSGLTDYSKVLEDDTVSVLPKESLDNTSQLIRGVKQELSTVVIKALMGGVKRWNVIIDPGIGFAKDASQNIVLLKHLPELRREETEFRLKENRVAVLPYWKNLEGFALLIGASRKSFIGKVLGKENEDPKNRLFGTASVCSTSVAIGANIVRVHDVKEMADVVRMADTIYK
jgi:dihydroneopterin aldolase / 2-amino-4-hydroxy-6-hydroxymethyldihydropteridine diphosphokinase / dihydropteroate synthase